MAGEGEWVLAGGLEALLQQGRKKGHMQTDWSLFCSRESQFYEELLLFHLIKIREKGYLQVDWALFWSREGGRVTCKRNRGSPAAGKGERGYLQASCELSWTREGNGGPPAPDKGKGY